MLSTRRQCGTHTVKHKTQIDKVQQRSARWVANDYKKTTSVTALMEELEWQSLEIRRKIHRLVIMRKILNEQIAIAVPPYIMPRHERPTRAGNMPYIQPCAGGDTYKYSYFPNTIRDWKRLPADVGAVPSDGSCVTPEAFKGSLEALAHQSRLN